MTTTGHPIAAEEVMAFVDGELVGAEARPLAEHFATCAECAELAQEFRRMSESFAAWTVEEVPAAVARGVEQALPAEPARLIGRRGVWALGGGALALSLTGVIVWVGILRPQREQRLTAFYYNEALSTKDAKGPQTVATDKELAAPSAGVLAYGGSAESRLSSTRFNDAPTPVAAPPPPPVKMPIGGGGAPSKLRVVTRAAEAPMIARTATLEMTVPSVADARVSVEAILARRQGYAAALTVSAEGDMRRELHASLKIPAAQLQAALGEIKSMGKVGQESQSGEDVNHQEEDLEARLKTARVTEERFRAILAERPGTVSDVMDVEENIERVRGDIEEMEAEQKDLHHRVDYATVELTMTQAPAQSSATPTAIRQIRKSLADGWHLAGDVLLGIAVFLGQYGLAILIWMGLLGAPAWFVWRRYRRGSGQG